MSGQTDTREQRRRSRRWYLRTVGAAATVTLAGCGSGSDDSADTEGSGQLESTPADEDGQASPPTPPRGRSTPGGESAGPGIAGVSVERSRSRAIFAARTIRVGVEDADGGTVEIRNPDGTTLRSTAVDAGAAKVTVGPDSEEPWPDGTYTAVLLVNNEAVDRRSFEVSRAFALRNFRQQFAGSNVQITFDAVATGNFWVEPQSLTAGFLADSPPAQSSAALGTRRFSPGDPATMNVTYLKNSCGVSFEGRIGLTARYHAARTDPFTISFGPAAEDDSGLVTNCQTGGAEGLAPVTSSPKE